MSFELFRDVGVRTKEYISVTENGAFGLPRTFINKQGITVEQKAMIFYDPNEKQIALHFTLEKPKFGLAVRIPNESQGGLVAAKSFFDSKDIDPKQYNGRYYDFEVKTLKELGFNAEGKAYVIKLVESTAPAEASKPVAETDTLTTAQEPQHQLSDIPF